MITLQLYKKPELNVEKKQEILMSLSFLERWGRKVEKNMHRILVSREYLQNYTKNILNLDGKEEK